MISKELSETLGFAVKEAKKRRHEYVGTEHLLFAIMHDSAGIEIIENCGGNIKKLSDSLENFFKMRVESVPDGVKYVLQQTAGFQRVIQRAFNQARSSEKQEVEVGDILAAIFDEKDSYAEYFLSNEGVSRLDVLNFISHEISKTGLKEGQGGFARTEKTDKKKRPDFLESFTIDLIKMAEEGRLDPLIGRDLEIERTLQVLCRRRKNNPVFVGDPGVGKTALAEGLAQKIFKGEVPEALRDIRIYSLDLGAVLAGTKFRGDFEQRLKGVINELQSRKNSVLFIDEIHTVVGAGSTSSGSMDASNILKPALATGELRCIGSTTYEEYKNYFTKDRALSRRFEKIEVPEPTVSETIRILKGVKLHYEEHHCIEYTDAALKAAAELSAKHVNDRYLPDKAIDVIDEAGAFVNFSGSSHRKKIHPADIEKIVAKMARIPENSVSASDRSKLENLEGRLKGVVFGQDGAIRSLVTSIKRSRAGLGIPTRPVGSFLFTGPTGVGKTEVARQISAVMGIEFMRFDMSEYMEKHAVARLIGAPPGYIGFEQGGLLTDGVRKHPHCVLLFDEIEKAHTDLFNILLQVLDHATLTDNNGKKADFRNVVIIMTSNAGAREMSAQTIGFGEVRYDPESKGKKAVENIFSPEFRNRLDDIINFKPLTHEIMEMVVDKFMRELKGQLAAKKVSLSYSGALRTWLAGKGHDPRYGARPLGRVLQTEIKDILSDEILFGKLLKGGSVSLDLENERPSFAFNAVSAHSSYCRKEKVHEPETVS
jgi:ATP-dependent Clp protease ATP-binding subunit ClpA